VASRGPALRLAGFLPERGFWQRGAEAELLRHMRGDPRQRHGHGGALLLGAETPILHHAHLLPGAHQPVPVHAGGEETAAGYRKSDQHGARAIINTSCDIIFP